ncbi:response regulator [Marinobacterium rhizophilum]|uniref:response regulator n=1 Tax=Marinobacterium rhizophilum TaxID=420402 RepID=UPI00037ED825|nr:response regulator [Marinobacterium rhizophilum]
MNSKTLISSSEAAKMLNVSLRTVQLWVEKGVLTAWKTPGGHRRIALESVQNLLHEQNVQAGFITEKAKVLVVEDDARQRKLYSKFFARWPLNIELKMAEDGFQGLMAVGSFTPDLLITDLMMPAMDGVQMINAIREQKDAADLKIIVVTAMDRDAHEVTQLRSQGITVLQKPLSFEELKQNIKSKVSMVS